MGVQTNALSAMMREKRNVTEDRVELLQLVSEPLKKEIHYEINMASIGLHPFFKLHAEVSPVLMRQVCHEATSRLRLSKGDILFSTGEVPQNPKMYFVVA